MNLSPAGLCERVHELLLTRRCRSSRPRRAHRVERASRVGSPPNETAGNDRAAPADRRAVDDDGAARGEVRDDVFDERWADARSHSAVLSGTGNQRPEPAERARVRRA
jgi:hypothetical protein